MSSFESSSSTDSTSFDDFFDTEKPNDEANQTSHQAMKLHQHKKMQNEQDNIMMQINSIIHCCEAGDFEKIEEILGDPTYDAAINSYADRLAHDAVSYGTPETARLILNDARIDPSGCQNLALRYALQNEKYEMVRLILTSKKFDASQTENDRPIVSFVLYYNQQHLLQLLLENESISSSQNEIDCMFGRCFRCSPEFQRLLVTRYGANVYQSIRSNQSYNSFEFMLEYYTRAAVQLMPLRPVVQGLHNVRPQTFKTIHGKIANQVLAFFLYCIGFRNYVINQNIQRKSVSKTHANFVLNDSMQLVFGLQQLNLPILLQCHLIDTVNEPLTHCVPWHWLWLYASSVKVF